MRLIRCEFLNMVSIPIYPSTDSCQISDESTFGDQKNSEENFIGKKVLRGLAGPEPWNLYRLAIL